MQEMIIHNYEQARQKYHQLDTYTLIQYFTLSTTLPLSTFVLSEREIKVSTNMNIMLNKKHMCVEILVIGRTVTWAE